jgi:hypothetical protein
MLSVRLASQRKCSISKSKGIDALPFLRIKIYEDCTIELKAKKISGTEGFRVVFGGSDLNNYFMADKEVTRTNQLFSVK